jgi:vancomycin permeability regulator SanA
MRPAHDIANADVALVLGSKVEMDGTPSVRLRARLDRTLELFREGRFPSVIVSGGTGKEGFDEAAVMRDYLISNGVPADRIIPDSHGDTAFASAANAARIARERNFRSVFVVSQYFHIPRARLALQQCRVSEVHSAHAHFSESRDIYSSVRETVGYASYLLRRSD